MNTTFIDMPIGDVATKGQLRKVLGDLSTLENSIKKLGLLYPVIVDKNNVLISGERRLAACKSVRLETIPVIKVDIEHDSMTALDIQSDVNLCRQALSQEDLRSLIDKKKSTMAAETTTSPGFFEKIRKLFAS